MAPEDALGRLEGRADHLRRGRVLSTQWRSDLETVGLQNRRLHNQVFSSKPSGTTATPFHHRTGPLRHRLSTAPR